MPDALSPYPAYKDSGVPWLGRIPAHWRIERAKWLFRKMDRPVRDSDDVVTCFRNGVVTLRKNRRVRGFTESLKEIGYQGVRRGDLVIHAMDAFAGAIGVSDSDGKGSPVYSVCEPNEGVNAYYYAFTVREMARSQWILALATGIRERSTDFRFATFASQRVPLPPPAEQHAITRYLDYMDRRIRRTIRARQKLIALLEEQKQAIIHQAVTRGLDPSVRLKPSGVAWLGDVPEHWEILALKRVLRRLIDCEHKTAPAVENSEFRVVRTTAVRNGKLRLEGTYCTTAEAFAEWTWRGTPEVGDVIFTREAPAGEACLVPLHYRVCLGQRTVLMKLKLDRYEPSFLVHTIYGGPPADRIRLASRGSTVDHFNMADIAELTVLVPSLAEQQTIVASIDSWTKPLEDAMAGAARQIALLREYRTRLLADVVTGQVDVRAAAAQLPEGVEEIDTLDEVEELAEDEENVGQVDEDEEVDA